MKRESDCPKIQSGEIPVSLSKGTYRLQYFYGDCMNIFSHYAPGFITNFSKTLW